MNGVLGSFFARRQRLNLALTAAAQRIDRWYERNQGPEPSLQALAIFEGLLAERRNLLEELAQLDDDMLVQLIKARGEPEHT
jgi:hypothetical protein